jgi:hypothetical protein
MSIYSSRNPPRSAFRDEQFSERRRKPRLNESLPARVWGIDNDDEVLSLDSELVNISSSGSVSENSTSTKNLFTD